MQLTELLRPEDFLLDLQAADKWDAIDQLFDHLVATGRIPKESRAALRDTVCLRERSMSTGMERGIAIPHAAVDGVDSVVAAVGIAREGLAFGSIDAQPARVIVLLVIPKAQKLQHIRTLAGIARVLGQRDVQEALLAAGTGEEAWDALRGGERARPG